MSDSIPILPRPHLSFSPSPSPSSFSSPDSFLSNSSLTSSSASSPSSSSKGKAPLRPSPPSSPRNDELSARRPSLLGSSLSQAEHTVINLSREEGGTPRLVSCVKSSQGFDWNQDLFLPSYASYDCDLEHKPDPVREIVLTEEEAEAMMPR